MSSLENTNLDETASTMNGENKYNLKKIDTEAIKNKVLMNNTFYAFKKSGNCSVCLTLPDIIAAIFVGGTFYCITTFFLLAFIVNVVTLIVFIYMIIFFRNKNRREAYENYLENQMLQIYKNDLTIMNYVPENLDYKTIQMIEVSGGGYEMARLNLIKFAFNLGADGVINLTHSATSTSNIRGNTKSGIETDTTTTVYMQGMAIKLV